MGWMGTRLTRARTLEHQVNGGMVRKGTNQQNKYHPPLWPQSCSHGSDGSASLQMATNLSTDSLVPTVTRSLLASSGRDPQ